MLERLQITRNCQFYVVSKKISRQYIKSILDSAVDNMHEKGEFRINILREDIEVDIDGKIKNCKVSIRVYPSEKKVYFLDDDIKDIIYAFIVIVEFEGYLGVLKKSCSNITSILEERLFLVDNSQLGATIDDREVEFQKLTLRNITVSDKAMRTRTYEAANLRGLLSPHAAGRSIPYAMKYRQGTAIRSISGVGRFIETSPRSSLKEVTKWVISQIGMINGSVIANNYLNTFAKKVKLSEVVSTCMPIAILIEANSLEEKLRSDNYIVRYTPKHGSNIRVSERIYSKLLGDLEKVHEIDDQLKIIGFKDNSRLRINNSSITMQSNLLTKFKVCNSDSQITLQKLIVKNGFYSVAFSDPKFMYFMGKCFEDSSGISDIQGILDILHPKQELLKVTSEKGSLNSRSTSFSNSSMFNIIEQIHNNDDFIFCDDLGVEWADHITINEQESCINFIHSKHGSSSTSASNLHEVVGQGIKNLGYISSSKEDFYKRAQDKFSKNYNNNNYKTRISRMRKGSLANLNTCLDSVFKDYGLHRKCILSCSFISKSSVEAEFKKIQSGQRVRGHIIQLLWILSSFVHATKEANSIPLIYCTP